MGEYKQKVIRTVLWDDNNFAFVGGTNIGYVLNIKDGYLMKPKIPFKGSLVFEDLEGAKEALVTQYINFIKHCINEK
jgi:hypothetical protein